MTEVNAEVWKVHVRVHGKTIEVSAGDGSQRVKWAAQVAIARWDEETMQGWKRIGVPTKIVVDNKREIDMNGVLRDLLKNGDTIEVFTSLEPYETR